MITTDRLFIRYATISDEDINFISKLWTSPDVMKYVGFPLGLKIDHEKIKEQIEAEIQTGTEYERVLLVYRKSDNRLVGSCKLGSINDDNIAHTDIKLDPEQFGNKYGVEIKKALLEYLFTNTDCDGVQGDPNVNNIASQKMQEAVGGIKIKESVYHFPEHMKDYTTSVHSYMYIVYRKDWEKRFSNEE